MKINFKAAFDKVIKYGNEHTPEITSGAGIILMVAGTVSAVCATIKTMRAVADAKVDKLTAIAEDEEEYEELPAEKQARYDYILDNPLPVKEAVKVSWKYWIVPFAATGAGIACSVYSDKAWAKKVGLATSALAYQIAEAKDYKEAAKEILGEEKEKEIEEEQTKRTAKRRIYRDEDVIDTGTGDQYYEEYYSGAMIKASPEYIQSCLNDLNEAILDNRERLGDDYDLAYKNDTSIRYVTISEWCNMLSHKIKTTGLTDRFGFDVTNGKAKLNYSPANCKILDNGRSCIILRFSYGNVPNYIDV